MNRAAAFGLVIGAALLAMAPDCGDAGERRYTTDEEAATWAGVGVIRSPKGSCTATLIRPDLVLTAAHCVADVGRRTVIAAGDVTFSAGVRNGRPADRVSAASISVHSGYFATTVYDERQIRVDVAKVHLERPVENAKPYRVVSGPSVGAKISLLSYSSGRMSTLSIQKDCRVEARRTEFLLVDCQSAPGASGSSLFTVSASGDPRIVGILSGGRPRDNFRTTLALTLDHVRDFIGATGPDAGGTTAAGGASEGFKPATRGLPGASKPGEGLRRFSE